MRAYTCSLHPLVVSSLLIALLMPLKTFGFPSVCSVVKTPQFRRCLDLKVSPSMCGVPPRPCAKFNYNIPTYFIEVNESKETFFKELPLAKTQMLSSHSVLPTVTDDDNGTFSYHARTINVPFASWAMSGLPCTQSQPPLDLFCFLAMSEHLGRLWKTGEADLWQPSVLAWSLSPKACLLKGAVTGLISSGKQPQSGESSSTPMCSSDRSFMKRFPPSLASVCTGWGIHFPRYATVESTDATTASLVIASRIKSLATEVFMSMPRHPKELWQMIYPQGSSCFQEGENIAKLRFKGVNERGRLFSGKTKGYLYALWTPLSCTQDISWVASSEAWLTVLEQACQNI